MKKATKNAVTISLAAWLTLDSFLTILKTLEGFDAPPPRHRQHFPGTQEYKGLDLKVKTSMKDNCYTVFVGRTQAGWDFLHNEETEQSVDER